MDMPGDTPEKHLAEKPLADGFYGCVWAYKGDLEFFGESMGLQNPNAHHPCNLCNADIRDASRPWTDHRAGFWPLKAIAPEFDPGPNPTCGVSLLLVWGDFCVEPPGLGVDDGAAHSSE